MKKNNIPTSPFDFRSWKALDDAVKSVFLKDRKLPQ